MAVSEENDQIWLNALMGAAADAIVFSDIKGRILRCNRAAETLFGYDPGELEGQSINLLMPEREARRHGDYIDRHMKTGESRIIGIGRDLEGRRKDGHVFPLHLSIGRAEAAGKTMFVAILHDLSRRRAAELALERSQRLEALGQMTGGISHDFNNVLALIIGNLELARGRGVPPEVAQLLEDAMEAAELGANLTRRLLAFARKSRLAPERLSLNAIVERTSALVRHKLPEAVRIDLALTPNIWPVEVDATEFQSALVNLLRNSEDAIGAEGVILVSTENIAIDEAYMAQEIDILQGSYVKVAVSDTGAGMTPEARQRAFEPFYSTKPVGNGTGLGLSTVYGFVRQSGGHVTLYSEDGQGTTVNVYLPAIDPTDGAARAEAGDVPVMGGNGETVLLVEDDARLRRLTSTRLRALGYTALEARDALEALRIIDSGERVDLVFSDVMMPGGMTGVDLVRDLRARRPELPVLLTTGYAGEMSDAELIDGFPLIRKPYRQEELAAAVRRALARG